LFFPELLTSPTIFHVLPPSDHSSFLANNSTNPDSFNPELRIRFLSKLLNHVLHPAKSDPQDCLDLQLHPPAKPTRLPKIPVCYGDWAYFSNIVDETIVEPSTMIEGLSSLHKDQ
jgi:hypothetical protein